MARPNRPQKLAFDPKKVCLSLDMIGYDDKLVDRATRQRVMIRDLSVEEGNIPDDYEPSSKYPQQAELDLTAEDLIECHVVGMYPRKGPHTALVKGNTTNKKRLYPGADQQVVKGGNVQDVVQILAHDEHALRVVVPCNKAQASYYALHSPDANGICKGWSVPQQAVYFFPEYRKDLITNMHDRRGAWAGLCRKAAGCSGRVKAGSKPRSVASNALDGAATNGNDNGGSTALLKGAMESLEDDTAELLPRSELLLLVRDKNEFGAAREDEALNAIIEVETKIRAHIADLKARLIALKQDK